MSRAVATSVACAISLESAKVCPAKACRRKTRHQEPPRLQWRLGANGMSSVRPAIER